MLLFFVPLKEPLNHLLEGKIGQFIIIIIFFYSLILSLTFPKCKYCTPVTTYLNEWTDI